MTLAIQTRIARWSVRLLAAAYAAWFGAYTCVQHARLKTYAYDLGTFDQGIWLAGHATDPFVTVRGLPLLGDHVRLFAYVLAPIYWIWDDVRFLLILQSVAIACGALFVLRISLRELPARPWLALVLAASWLLHPAVQNLNLDHAHPDAFATTLVLAAVDALRAGRVGRFALAAGLAMSCKEDVPLVFVMLGLVTMLDRRQRRIGAVIAAVSATYFALCMTVILPHFNEAGFFRYGRKGFLTGFWMSGGDPAWIAGKLLGDESLRYLYRIGLPNLYLFLLSPLAIVPAAPALFANLIADASYMRDLSYHYQTSIVPFLYLGTIATLVRLDALRTRASASAGASASSLAAFLGAVRTSAPAALLVAVVGANLAWSKAPIGDPGVLWTNLEDSRTHARLRKVREIVAFLPRDAAVSADYTIVPQLSHRRRIYMFPNPFGVSYWGVDGEKPHDPESIDFILVSELRLDEYARAMLANLELEGSFERIYSDLGLRLYRRVAIVPLGADAGCGDWDGDGRITSDDVRLIARAILKNAPCPPEVCDADGDGAVRPGDAARIGRRVEHPEVALSCPAGPPR